MEIPTELKIGPFIWAIETSKDVSLEGNCYGSTHHTTQKIFLDPTNSPQRNEATLIHEILHVIWETSSLTKVIEQKLEEQIVHTLSLGIYQALKDNNLLK